MDDSEAEERRWVVTGDGRPDAEYGDEDTAVAAAGTRPESHVVCLAARGKFRTRQTVYPTVGPLYTEGR